LNRFSTNIAYFRTWQLGDVNMDWSCDILDIIYLIDFKFKDGPAATPTYSGDINADCRVDILDIIYLIDYKFKTGPASLVGCE